MADYSSGDYNRSGGIPPLGGASDADRDDGGEAAETDDAHYTTSVRMVTMMEEMLRRVSVVERRLDTMPRDIGSLMESTARIQTRMGAKPGYITVTGLSSSDKAAATGKSWIRALVYTTYHIYWQALDTSIMTKPVTEQMMSDIVQSTVSPDIKAKQQMGSLMAEYGTSSDTVPLDLCLSVMSRCTEMLTVLRTTIVAMTTTLSVLLPPSYVSCMAMYVSIRVSDKGVPDLTINRCVKWKEGTYGSGCMDKLSTLSRSGVRKVVSRLVMCTGPKEVKDMCSVVRKLRNKDATDLEALASGEVSKKYNRIVVVGVATPKTGTSGGSDVVGVPGNALDAAMSGDDSDNS